MLKTTLFLVAGLLLANLGFAQTSSTNCQMFGNQLQCSTTTQPRTGIQDELLSDPETAHCAQIESVSGQFLCKAKVEDARRAREAEAKARLKQERQQKSSEKKAELTPAFCAKFTLPEEQVSFMKAIENRQQQAHPCDRYTNPEQYGACMRGFSSR